MFNESRSSLSKTTKIQLQLNTVYESPLVNFNSHLDCQATNPTASQSRGSDHKHWHMPQPSSAARRKVHVTQEQPSQAHNEPQY